VSDSLDLLLGRIEKGGDREALVFRDRAVTYRELYAEVLAARQTLLDEGVPQGGPIVLRADFSPRGVAMFLALAAAGNVVVPITPAVRTFESFCEIAEAEGILEIEDEAVRFRRLPGPARHPLLVEIRHRKSPGLILFSSGSTGVNKAAVHDLDLFLTRFRNPRPARRGFGFLLFDHIGGLNTLFHSLASHGTLATTEDRSPENVFKLIEKHRIELLPTSPSFLTLALLSGAHRGRDLSSLRVITYGTEPMPERTLRELATAFPWVELKQTYGLSELGILQTKSRASDSLWVRVGGEGYETRVVGGVLHIRAPRAMLGYLNAPSPFDGEGWFDTKDRVEVDGEWLRILGRDGDAINVGGLKVDPTAVEAVLLEIPNIVDAQVYGVPNDIMGFVIGARLRLAVDEPMEDLRREVRRHARSRLGAHQVPAVIEKVDRIDISFRFKRSRR
jgi:acyl-coenzyme A synthetase/AMP-(fatty) acid ligase